MNFQDGKEGVIFPKLMFDSKKNNKSDIGKNLSNFRRINRRCNNRKE